MGNEASQMGTRRWIYENVLFLDPDADDDPLDLGLSGPTETPEEEEESRLRRCMAKPRVKRFTPSHAKLRNRFFNIGIELQGRVKEFVLKLVNDPDCALILCDKSGEELRSIPASKLLYVQRKNLVINAYFSTSTTMQRLATGRGAMKEDGSQSAAAVLAFHFEDASDCTAFCDSMKMLFGIPVRAFGVIGDPTAVDRFDIGEKLLAEPQHSIGSSSNESSSDDERRAKKEEKHVRPRAHAKALNTRTACPIHGDASCGCNIERPVISSEVAGLSSEGDESEESEAEYSDKYPISIEGRCENGCDLRYKDVSAVGRRTPGRVIEWFISIRAGKDPTFPVQPFKSSNVFQPEDSMVGHYVKVRVTRRVPQNAVKPFVYSVATKGPITINDVVARSMLEFLTQTAVPVDMTCDRSAVMILFGLQKTQVPIHQPFFEGHLWILRQGIVLRALIGDEVERSLAWTDFFATRKADEDEVLETSQEDLSLVLHTLGYDGEECASTVELPSEVQRNNVFHTLAFYKLCRSFSNFDRWERDLTAGNYSAIKTHYAKLWASTAYREYAQIAPPPIADDDDNYRDPDH